MQNSVQHHAAPHHTAPHHATHPAGLTVAGASSHATPHHAHAHAACSAMLHLPLAAAAAFLFPFACDSAFWLPRAMVEVSVNRPKKLQCYVPFLGLNFGCLFAEAHGKIARWGMCAHAKMRRMCVLSVRCGGAGNSWRIASAVPMHRACSLPSAWPVCAWDRNELPLVPGVGTW